MTTENIALPRQSMKWLFRELALGLKSRVEGMLWNGRGFEVGSVRDFFKRARGREQNFEICDLNDPKYELLIHDWEGLEFGDLPLLSVLDLGCGACKFHSVLKRRGVNLVRYVGIDLVFTEKERAYADANNVELVAADFRQCDFDGREDAWELGVAVNSLCYVPDLESAPLDQWFCRAKRVLVIEPVPSLLWESHFDGVQVFLRTPTLIDRCFSRLGWKLRHRRVLHVMKVFHACLVPWTSASLYVRVGEAAAPR